MLTTTTPDVALFIQMHLPSFWKTDGTMKIKKGFTFADVPNGTCEGSEVGKEYKNCLFSVRSVGFFSGEGYEYEIELMEG